MKLSSRAVRSVGLYLVAAMVVFVTGAAIGLEVASRDRVLPGVVVLGVPVGGLSVSDAAARLAPTAAAIVDQPLQLQVGERSWKTTPRAMGMRLDPAELAGGAFSLGRLL